jgi:dihydropteroate synthase/dihydroneopterin aldolase
MSLVSEATLGLPVVDGPVVMGVVNVTPDSFSDGGQWFEPSDAVRQGLALASAGAHIVDVGGESTRPGAERPSVAEELDRVLPVISELAAEGLVVSADTMRAEVARQALEAGATLVNDVSGGAADPEVLAVVAAARVPYICMHWRGHSASMQERTAYDDVVTDVITELATRLEAADRAGVDLERVVVDPGIGFAKLYEHNWEILRRIGELRVLGRPVLVGASRKAFLGALLARPDGTARPALQRDVASAAVSALLADGSVWGLRVHDVASTVDAIAVQRAMRPVGSPAPSRGVDRLTVTGIRAQGHHGVLDFERRDGQQFVVDVRLELDTGPAARSDHLSDTVDYGELATRLHAAVESDPVDLVETLAERLASICLSYSSVDGVEVTVHKPQAPIAVAFDDVTLTIERRRA